MGWGSRASGSNYVFNHLGNFAAAGEATCRSLILSGVTRRFPELRFAFLEGGVSWACTLFADLLGHWEKRNRQAIHHYDPAELDRSELARLFKQYGSREFAAHADSIDPRVKADDQSVAEEQQSSDGRHAQTTQEPPTARRL